MSFLTLVVSIANILCSSLKATIPDHPLLTDLEQKNELFDKAAAKYAVKVAA